MPRLNSWRGTHELIARRLAVRNWGHVQFNGSVPSERRGALVERFHTDAACRLFLSTDAGGVGLNLQHAAAVVVNMDLPWNPAVLEQRIGRVHRLGQRRGVQAISFVGQGSIEEGMLSTLAFKSSLFAGVLDGGAGDVFLQGSRLSQFMRDVEDVTATMGEPDTTALAAPEPPVAAEPTDAAPTPADASADDGGGNLDADSKAPPQRPPEPEPEPAPQPVATDPTPAPPVPADPWPALLQAGIQLLTSLSQVGSASATATTPQGGPDAPGQTPARAARIETDPLTGQPSLRLPLPPPEVLRSLAQALAPFLKG